VRIWSYAIAAAMLVLVVLIRTGGPPTAVSAGVRALAVMAVAVNVLAMTPMLDDLTDRYALTTRLLMSLPVLAATAWLFVRRDPGPDVPAR
jgi:hypothetical protein